MKKIKYIFLSTVAALSLVSCQKEPIEPVNPGDVPEGYVKMEIESSDDFGNIELTTRSGDNALIATAREMAIKNAYICVFEDNENPETDKLIQFKPVIRDVVGSTTMYYGVLEEVKSPVILHGVSNIDQATIGEISATEAGGAYSMTLQEFYNNVNMTYPGTTNQILRNSDEGLLPKYVDKIELSELTREKIKDVEAVTRFSFARIDVVMPEPYTDYPQVLGISVPNAPTLPYSPSRIQTFVESHEVTPLSNEHSYSGEFWPEGVTTNNQATKYVQGMYIYSTEIGTNTISDIAQATYLIIRARKDASSPSGGTYYKIALRLRNGITGEYDYSIKASIRYLVRVHALDSDGYASMEEAIAGPPSNINYDITIDGTSTSVTSNGQYYIGTEKAELSAEGKSQSNMVFKNPRITEFTHRNDESWTINDGGSLGVDLVFTYNAGDASIAASDLTTKEIILPEGVEFDNTVVGYDNTTWNNNFGTKKLRLKVTKGDVDGDIEIKVGELTHRVKFAAIGEIYTDYTDMDVVKELTNLDYTYGGVPPGQVRVANSYIVAPMETATTVFYIPVAERINEFWNTTDGYADDANETDTYAELLSADWTNNTNYSVELSWYDGADVDDLVVEKAYSPAGKNAIKVTLPPKFEHQNIAINVKYGTDIIWSWHLWVTDYNPYFVTLKENSSSVAAYPLRTQTDQIEDMAGSDNSDKELHSYTGEIWETGIYKDKFIMDRDIGSFAANSSGYGGSEMGKGYLNYQFGRKDPFPGSAAKYAQGYSLLLKDSENNLQSYADAVKTPNTIYYNGATFDWTSEPESDNYDVLWYDKYLEKDSAEGKSIFDPSPLGFRVPEYNVFENINTSTAVISDGGRLYNRYAYFNFGLTRGVADGNVSFGTTVLRTSTPGVIDVTKRHSYNLLISPTNVSNALYSRASCFSVRPIQE